MPEIIKIVITGGPCAGKSTAMSWIQNAFTQMGYKVLFVPETATEFITGGVAPWTCGTNVEYQKCQMTLQLEKERLFEQAARTMSAEKIIIVCDRGTIDNKAYMTDDEFNEVLDYLGLDEQKMLENYDAVFHLVTAAKGAAEFYTTANNSARTETVEQAAELDNKLIAAWRGHPRLKIVDNSLDFEYKMRKLIAEMAAFLGEPNPYAIERKYLIEYPDIEWLKSEHDCQRTELIQTYLISGEGKETRITQKGSGGEYIYFKTTKKKVAALKTVEIEKRLSHGEYLALLTDADKTKKQIYKTRYSLTYKNQHFEIDLYAFWGDKAIVKIKLSDKNDEVMLPEQLRVIREVTGEEAYKNVNLADI